MTRNEFIGFLKDHDLRYAEYTEKGLDQVYVFSRVEYDLRQKYPRKFKNLYVPYLRVSNFDGDWYTREDGWCCYMPTQIVLEKCLKLGES